MAAKSTADDSWYEALDSVLVRAPLLPVERYLGLTDERAQFALLSDPRVVRGLAVGSASLLAAIGRFNQSELNARDAERMRAKLLRYQIRMSTRPTPFGLFAGVALSEFAPLTDLLVCSTSARIRTRPDMAWLMGLVVSAESDLAIRRRLRLVANPLASIEAGRVTLAERAPVRAGAQGGSVSVRATTVVKQALTLARTPIPYADLVHRLCEGAPAATPEKVETLLSQLWEQTLLLTDLRPPLTIADPARYVAERLRGIPDAAGACERLDALLGAAADWDRLDHDRSVPAFTSLLALAGGAGDGSPEAPVQVDMAGALEGFLGRAVAAEAARAAELLVRLSPMPQGLSSLASYRQGFISRYGHDREVPLLEMLSAHRGLGPPSTHGHTFVGPDPQASARRSQLLLQLACGALHDRRREIVLDETHLARLQTWPATPDRAPRSLDINLLVGASSAEAIDRGDFTVVVGPNLGALEAGRNLGRFADLLGARGPQALARMAEAEAARAPGHLWAELVYLPQNLRSANVMVRPAVRPFEAPLGVSAGVPAPRVIPLDELVVGVEHGRFYIRWPAADARVIFTAGHMLNNHHAPPIGRFLVDVGLDGRAIFSSFDWGPAENFPYLPRVRAGRIVLRPAQWRVQKEDVSARSTDAFSHALARWRAEWDMPRHVCLGVGDNRLVLDLDRDFQAAQVRTELQKLAEDGAIVLQEVCPALDEAWLSGPEGHYYSEITVSLVRRLGSEVEDRERTAAPALSTHPRQLVSEGARRLHPPGSPWLFVKLYGARDTEDDVIGASLLTFADNAVASELADSWFFIRYADPDPHVRLRFHGVRDRLVDRLFRHVCDWADGLMSEGLCLKFVFDAYEQEVERFGGAAAMTAAEALFFADSRAAARLIRARRTREWPHDPIALAVASVDDLLAGLGLDEQARLRWYRAQTSSADPDVGAEYRQRKNLLRTLLGDTQELVRQPGGAEIASALAARREALAPVGRSLRDLDAQGLLTQSFDTLLASFVHLHANRLGGLDSTTEQRILGLLARTRDSLAKAPLTPVRSASPPPL